MGEAKTGIEVTTIKNPFGAMNLMAVTSTKRRANIGGSAWKDTHGAKQVTRGDITRKSLVTECSSDGRAVAESDVSAVRVCPFIRNQARNPPMLVIKLQMGADISARYR